MRLKKSIVVLAMAFVTLSHSFFSHAAKVVQIPATELYSVYYQNVQSNAVKDWPTGPNIFSEAGIVMDVDTGAILYAKNIDNPHYPASITKILTALVALENSELTDIVTVSREDYSFLEYDDNHIALKAGEKITMKDALYGTLLASGNDAAHAVGSNCAGGYDNFLKLMNEKAKELGCTNSNFTNTHGLHDKEHYTSARDMALISAAAFQNEEFMKITGTKEYAIPETNITNEKRYFQQHHKMMFKGNSQYYQYCVGGKTGYTDNALNTLVTFATKGDMNLVAVVLRTHGTGNSYVDTKAMLNYAFNNFQKHQVTPADVNDTRIETIDTNAYVTIPKTLGVSDLQLTVKEPELLGELAGEMVCSYENMPVGSFGMTITEKYHNEKHGIEIANKDNQPKQNNKPIVEIIVKIVITLLAVLIILYLLLVCYAIYKRRQKKKRRAAMRRRKREREYWRHMRQMRDED